MELLPLRTRRIASGEDLVAALGTALARARATLKNGDVLVIASKVVAYCEERLISVKSQADFRELIRKEADAVLHDGDMILTLKNQVLIPNAGIDQSNTPQGLAILWPADPFMSARVLRRALKKKFRLKTLGVLISDSHCQPLRLGTSGIAIGWAGFEGVTDVRGSKDLFGKPMKYTRIATADDLCSAANLLMGETDAAVPFVIVRGFKTKFTERAASAKDYFITPKECLYRPLYSKTLLNNF